MLDSSNFISGAHKDQNQAEIETALERAEIVRRYDRVSQQRYLIASKAERAKAEWSFGSSVSSAAALVLGRDDCVDGWVGTYLLGLTAAGFNA